MALSPEQYDIRGTKSSWRHWKRRLKRDTARKRRKVPLDEDPKRVTRGWVD
jgi:hypothetical protein